MWIVHAPEDIQNEYRLRLGSFAFRLMSGVACRDAPHLDSFCSPTLWLVSAKQKNISHHLLFLTINLIEDF